MFITQRAYHHKSPTFYVDNIFFVEGATLNAHLSAMMHHSYSKRTFRDDDSEAHISE